MNRVIAVQKDNGLIAAYSYDLRGNRSIQKYPAANLETSYGYNFAGLMTELYNKKNGKVVSQFKYTYGIDGNQLTKKNGELETAYEYDKLGRLIAAREVNGNTYLYEYDAFSNRSSLTVSGYDNYATTYEYDINNRLLAETRVEKDFTKKSAYTYDKNGNQIRRSTETIEGKKPWSPPERHLFITATSEKVERGLIPANTTASGSLWKCTARGKELISAIGQMECGYDPAIGRFVSEDLIKDGENWYSYCSGNPVAFGNKTGLSQYRIGEMDQAPSIDEILALELGMQYNPNAVATGADEAYGINGEPKAFLPFSSGME